MQPHNWIKIKDDSETHWHQFECFNCKKQISCRYFIDPNPKDKYIRVMRQVIGPIDTRINLECEPIKKDDKDEVL